jgi:hypothetical protein
MNTPLTFGLDWLDEIVSVCGVMRLPEVTTLTMVDGPRHPALDPSLLIVRGTKPGVPQAVQLLKLVAGGEGVQITPLIP